MRVLAWAVTRGEVVSLKLLLTYGADSNQAVLYGDTPLIRAARAVISLCIEPLIKYQADVNAQDTWKVTALMDTVGIRDDVRYILPLVKTNANLELTDKYGRTALGVR